MVFAKKNLRLYFLLLKRSILKIVKIICDWDLFSVTEVLINYYREIIELIQLKSDVNFSHTHQNFCQTAESEKCVQANIPMHY